VLGDRQVDAARLFSRAPRISMFPLAIARQSSVERAQRRLVS
jgi:hypothetical protein